MNHKERWYLRIRWPSNPVSDRWVTLTGPEEHQQTLVDAARSQAAIDPDALFAVFRGRRLERVLSPKELRT